MRKSITIILSFLSSLSYSQSYLQNSNDHEIFNIIDSTYNFGFKKTFWIIPMADNKWKDIGQFMQNFDNNSWGKFIGNDSELSQIELEFKSKPGINVIDENSFYVNFTVANHYPSFRNVMTLFVNYKAIFTKNENSIEIEFKDFSYSHYQYDAASPSAITPFVGFSPQKGLLKDLLNSHLPKKEKNDIALSVESEVALVCLKIQRHLKAYQ